MARRASPRTWRCRHARIGSLVIEPLTRFLRGVPQTVLGSPQTMASRYLYVRRHGMRSRSRVVLPKEGRDDPDRLEATYVPADTGCLRQTKACDGNDRTRHKRAVPFKWVARYGYGCRDYRSSNYARQTKLCARSQQRLMCSVLGQAPISLWHLAADIASTPAFVPTWKRLSAGTEPKGRAA